MMNNNIKLGATGKFPDGKLNKDDEGELRMKIGESKGRVIIDFGKPVTWFGLDKKSAIEFAESVLKHAKDAK